MTIIEVSIRVFTRTSRGQALVTAQPNRHGRTGEMFTNREQKRVWIIAFAAPLVTGSLVVGASTMLPLDGLYKLGRGPIMAIVWLTTPAILIIGSIVGGL